jgi:hypothetical protein
MPNPVFEAIVSTQDRSSPVLQAITRRIETLEHAAEKTQLATERMALRPIGALAGLRGSLGHVAGAFGHVRGVIGEVMRGITELMPPLAALGGAGSLAGMFELVNHVSEAREGMLHMAETIGMAPGALAKLNFAARMTGTDVESMHTGMTKLNKVIGEVAGGKNKDAAALFAKMGVSLAEIKTGDAATVLPKIAAAFQATENPALRARMAVALFGRGGQQMIAMLARGPKELHELGKELDRLGYKFSEVDDRNLVGFRHSWIELQTAVGGFTNMLGAKLAPVLGPVVDQFTDWIAANRQWIATQITEKMGEFVRWLRAVDWNAVGRGIRDVFTRTGEWLDKIGGVKVALIGLGIISLAPIVAKVVEVTQSVITLARALDTTLVAAFGRAAVAGDAFNARMMRLPAYRMMALGMNLWDTAHQGTPVTQADIGRMSDAERQRFGITRSEGGQWEYRNPQTGEMVTPSAGAAAPVPQTNILGGKPWGDWLWDRVFGSPVAPAPGLPSLTAPGAGVPALPSLYGPPASAPAVPGAQQGAVDVNVKFANAPPGTQVDVQSTGAVRAPPAQVGYAFGFERAAFA